MEYPLIETKQESTTIDAFLGTLGEQVKAAKARFDDIVRDLGRPTRMVIPRTRNWFVPFHRVEKTFDLVKAHHYRNVLLVALRLRWRPEDVLALWQTEGLPVTHRHEDDTPGRFLVVRDWYGREPNSEAQARAWAISAVLWERWGLDKLISRSGPDNEPKASSAEEHIKAFEAGFSQECAEYLKDSPYSYLSDPVGAIELRRDSGVWQFRTRPQYQATLLALQTARMRAQVKRIPHAYLNFEVPVFTRTVFPAALYMHYNSKNAEEHLFRIAKLMIAAHKEAGVLVDEYDGQDMHRCFVGTPLPRDIERRVPRVVNGIEMYNGHSWVNALRYECLRQTYAVLFVEFKSAELPSMFLRDE